MLNVIGKNLYKAFGLSISSDLPLPELIPIDNNHNLIDIEIKIEDLSSKKIDLIGKSFDFEINQNQVLFQISKIATFLIENGKTITISPEKEADIDLIRLFTLGTCMGAILMQRKILPLHGSAVAINGKAYAIVGDSGAGKSTLALAFLEKGYQLLTDDVIAVSLINNQPFVTPSYPQQKLWKESLDRFGMENTNYQSIFGRENKYCIPISDQYITSQLPLAGVFELIKTDNFELGIYPIQNLERFPTLFYHTYRNFFIKRLGLMDWHFEISAKMVKNMEYYRLCRPIEGFSVPQLVNLILNKVDKGE